MIDYMRNIEPISFKDEKKTMIFTWILLKLVRKQLINPENIDYLAASLLEKSFSELLCINLTKLLRSLIFEVKKKLFNKKKIFFF